MHETPGNLHICLNPLAFRHSGHSEHSGISYDRKPSCQPTAWSPESRRYFIPRGMIRRLTCVPSLLVTWMSRNPFGRDIPQFKYVLESIGKNEMPENEMHALMSQADLNRDGKVRGDSRRERNSLSFQFHCVACRSVVVVHRRISAEHCDHDKIFSLDTCPPPPALHEVSILIFLFSLTRTRRGPPPNASTNIDCC